MVNASDGCVGVSEPLLECLRSQHRVDPARLRLLPCGVDTEFFPFVPLQDRQPTRVLTVARLSEPKDLLTAVRAGAWLRDRGVRFEWIVIGEGPERPELEAEIERLRMQNYFRLAGPADSDAVRAALADAAVFALSSVSEGAPVAIMEAMATGTPVVSTNVGGIPSLVANGESGLLVRAGRPEELGAALAELLSSPERRLGMGTAARRIAQERFSLRHQVDELLSFWVEARGRSMTEDAGSVLTAA